MRPTTNTYTVTATDADGICQSQTPLAAGAMTINGALLAGIPTGQHVTVTCAGADSDKTFIITGLNENGNLQSETIAGAGTGTTTGTKNFKIVTSVVASAATAGAITVGFVQTFETPWIPLDHYVNPFNYSYSVDVGAATFLVEGTLSDIQDSSVTAVPFTVEASGTIDVSNSKTAVARAIRLKVTSYTSGTITFLVMQSGF